MALEAGSLYAECPQTKACLHIVSLIKQSQSYLLVRASVNPEYDPFLFYGLFFFHIHDRLDLKRSLGCSDHTQRRQKIIDFLATFKSYHE